MSRHIPLVAVAVDLSGIDFDALEVRQWDDNCNVPKLNVMEFDCYF